MVTDDQHFLASEKLRAALELTRAVTEGVADAIFVTDPSIRVIFMNHEAERIFGFRQSELAGKNLHCAIHHHYPDGRPSPLSECHLTVLFGSSRTIRNFDDVFFRKDGSAVHVSCSTAPVEVSGRRLGAVLVLHDITERKQTKETLMRSEKMALAGRIAATVAHEINNPLAAVMNTLFLARSCEVPLEVRHYLDSADAELRRISQITRRALGFYRDSEAPAVTSIDVILDSAIDLLMTNATMSQVTIKRQYNDNVEVMAVSGELRQIFTNLIANSLDAVDRRGTITLRVSSYRRFDTGVPSVRVTIADNGGGIAERAKPHIFDSFYTTKGSAGTGLGLWVCKQFVEKYGGTIRVHSCSKGPWRGTTVSVTFPAATQASAVQTDAVLDP